MGKRLLGWGELVLESFNMVCRVGRLECRGCYKVWVSRLLGWGGLVLESIKWCAGLGGSGVGGCLKDG